MRSILKSCYKFLPPFPVVVLIFLLVLALVPGRLEYAIGSITMAISLSILFGVPFLLVTIFTGISMSRLSNIRDFINSLFILVCSLLSLQIHLPARLYFFTSIGSFEQALIQLQTKEGKHQQIEKIGNFEIRKIDVSDENNPSKDAIYFYTMADSINKVSMFDNPDSYGFAYLPNARATKFIQETTHIWGKWYIFRHNSSTGG